jgi:hypothetical protein
MKRNFILELTYNAYNSAQLLQYLKDEKADMNDSNMSILRAGYFFDKAYGLGCSRSELVDLGRWIFRGDFLKYPDKFKTIKPEW